MELFLVGLLTLIVGFCLGAKLIARTTAHGINEIKKNQAIDRANYLFTLRRELANILIWRDPQRYVKLSQELRTEFSTLKSWHLAEINKRLSELSKKYPFYDDFDIIRTKEYVLYLDNSEDYEQLEAGYRDIATFVALSFVGNPSWKDAPQQTDLVSDKLEHLLRYVERIEDTKLVIIIDRAMEAYRKNEHGLLDNDLYAVKILRRQSFDLRYAVHIKRTNEFAIKSTFIHDGGDATHNYFSSDAMFEKERLLHPLTDLLGQLKQAL